MGAAKIQLTLSILEGGGGVDTVVVSDSGGWAGGAGCWGPGSL